MLRTVDQLLKDSSSLGKIVAQAMKLKKLGDIFEIFIDHEFKGHCKLAKVEQNQIMVIIDNATWATKFRYAIPDILKNLRTQPEFKKITKINYRVSSNPSLLQPQQSKES